MYPLLFSPILAFSDSGLAATGAIVIVLLAVAALIRSKVA